MTPYDRLAALGLSLPPPPAPIATYVPFVREDNILYLSGQGPRQADGMLRRGKVGAEIGIEQAYDDARLTGLNLLAVIHSAIGDLSRVRRVVKLLGMVNAVPDFEAHPKVINGCSDLLLEVFGERGRHARSAVGFGSLPDNITVEIEAIVAVEP
ncbi:RidA family protein [Aminobacter sp. Piv2-1]|uniref:RidA family protein n=1 Tax=Aminobacter sp. Piv2-1 TaxID=3031122 RepID=UPI0030994671